MKYYWVLLLFFAIPLVGFSQIKTQKILGVNGRVKLDRMYLGKIQNPEITVGSVFETKSRFAFVDFKMNNALMRLEEGTGSVEKSTKIKKEKKGKYKKGKRDGFHLEKGTLYLVLDKLDYQENFRVNSNVCIAMVIGDEFAPDTKLVVQIEKNKDQKNCKISVLQGKVTVKRNVGDVKFKRKMKTGETISFAPKQKDAETQKITKEEMDEFQVAFDELNMYELSDKKKN